MTYELAPFALLALLVFFLDVVLNRRWRRGAGACAFLLALAILFQQTLRDLAVADKQITAEPVACEKRANEDLSQAGECIAAIREVLTALPADLLTNCKEAYEQVIVRLASAQNSEHRSGRCRVYGAVLRCNQGEPNCTLINGQLLSMRFSRAW